MGLFDRQKKKFVFGQDQNIPEVSQEEAGSLPSLPPQVPENKDLPVLPDEPLNPTTEELLSGPQEKTPLAGLLKTAMSGLSSGPQLAPYPVKPVGFKEALKQTGISMIPVIGGAYARSKMEERKAQLENWKLQNVQAEKTYEMQKAILAPLMLKQAQMDMENQEAEERTNKIQILLGISRERAWFMGHKLPIPKDLQNIPNKGQEEPIRFSKMDDLPDQNGSKPMYTGTRNTATGFITFKNPVTGEPAMDRVGFGIDRTFPMPPAPEAHPERQERAPHYFKGKNGNLWTYDPETNEAKDTGSPMHDTEGGVESWSPPVPWYDETGKPVVIQSSNRGQIRRVDLPAGAQSKTGLTAQTRQLGETARAIIPKFDSVIKKLDDPKLIAKIGPSLGRWNEFLAGKVGAGDPDFAALRVTIGLLQTGAMRAHVGSRGGVGLLEKFENLINAKHMDAPTLKSSLTAMRDFLKGYRDQVFPGEADKASSFTVEHGGKIYSFPNQESLEGFKKEMGIK